MVGTKLGSFAVAAPWLMVAVTATVCSVKDEIDTKQAVTEYNFDARYTGSDIVSIKTISSVACVHRCLRECLCYHVNYKAIGENNWACELVSYSACGVRSGVRIEGSAGWFAVKLSKGSEDPFIRQYCCKLTEPEQSMMAYCHGACTIFPNQTPQFGLSLKNDGFKWRCYDESSLDNYYFNTSSLYCTRNSQLSNIFNKFTSNDHRIGQKGQSCMEVCSKEGKVCSSSLQTLNTVYLFHRLGINCQYNRNESDCFTNTAHPVYYPATGRCHGYIDVPINYDCAHGVIPDAQRLCKCVDP